MMAGGVFAITSSWFFESGAYDPALEVWGIENVEMALRVWTCGGGLYTLPCSRVGHVFRSKQPFSWPRKFELRELLVSGRLTQLPTFFSDRR